MYARALQARRACLLLIDAWRNKGGKGGWEERHSVLLELVVTLFCLMFLRAQEDRIAKAAVCYKESLQTRREFVLDARDGSNLFHPICNLS